MLLVLAVIQKSSHNIYFQLDPEMFENFRAHFFLFVSLWSVEKWAYLEIQH